MTTREIHEEYREWLIEIIHKDRNTLRISYDKLLKRLYHTDFIFLIPKDQNRAEDGEALRYRFALAKHREMRPETIMDLLEGPCSILEMMVALAIRCEEDIMDDPNIGDRTGQWFWGMIVNLGLGSMRDDRYDEEYVDMVLDRFLNLDYEPDGRGGLFFVRHCDRDLRDVEIWHQLCWYLDGIT